MGLKRFIKEKLAASSINKKKKKTPFDMQYSEHYTLADDADRLQNNSYYFSAHGINGESLLLRHASRGGGETEIWFAYRSAEGKLYLHNPQHYETKDLPMSVNCKLTGKEWSFKFSGKVDILENDSNNVANVKSGQCNIEFNGEFVARKPIFEFSRHMHARPMARAIAGEKWTKEFFAEIQNNHQVHYEQLGVMVGKLKIDGVETSINLPAMRDHSYGKRDWNYMDCHIWLMALLENGDALNVNMVSYPALKTMQAGYYEFIKEEKKTICLDYATPISSFEANGFAPKQFTYKATLVDGTRFDVTVNKQTEFIFPFDNGAYIICEGVGEFDVNGVKARGIIEFGFNKDETRWLFKK